MSKIFIFVGASGSGKTASAQYIRDHFCAEEFISTTTREPRKGETNGVSYYFVDRNTFRLGIVQEKFLEYTLYNGNYYGTAQVEIERTLNHDSIIVAVMDIRGALTMRKKFPKNVVLIFINAPLALLVERMKNRGDSDEVIQERVNNLIQNKELVNGKYCDYIVDNTGSPFELQEHLNQIMEKEGVINEL